jgi:hypothetical protein
MTQARAKSPKTERINLCITAEDRRSLEWIAEREDRDLGYLAAWFLRWGMEHYLASDATLVTLRDSMSNGKGKGKGRIEQQAQWRLGLREEAQFDSGLEKKKA